MDFQIDMKKRSDWLGNAYVKKYDEANKLWRGVIRLLITLSSSFLVLTISFVKALFPSLAGELPSWIYFSWVAFFLAIIFGLNSEIDETIFQGNVARSWQNEYIEIQKKLANGIKAGSADQATPVKENTIMWGTLTMISFVMAVVSLCAAMLQYILPIPSWIFPVVWLLIVGGSSGILFKKYSKRFNKASTKIN